MIRADLFEALEIVLSPWPVVSHPLLAVMPPAFVLGGATRGLTVPAFAGAWSGVYDLIGIAGRMDDHEVYVTCDTLQNLVCTQSSKVPGTSQWEQRSAPDRLTIGEVDYLAFTFQFLDHDVVGVC